MSVGEIAYSKIKKGIQDLELIKTDYASNITILKRTVFLGDSTGKTDVHTQFMSTLERAENGRLILPPGVFLISDDLLFNWRVSAIEGQGADTELVFTKTNNPNGIKPVGITDFVLSNLTLRTEVANTRNAGGFGVCINNCKRVRLEGVHIPQWQGMGILGWTSEDLIVNECYIEYTTVDGIHFTNGCKRVSATKNKVTKVGDDGIASVTYVGQPMNEDISFIDNDIWDTGNPNITANPGYGARAISMIGTRRGHININRINRPHHGGINISADTQIGTYTCQGTEGIEVFNNIISDPKYDVGGFGLISVWTNVPGQTISDISIKDNKGRNSNGPFLWISTEDINEQGIQHIKATNNEFYGMTVGINKPAFWIKRVNNVELKDNYAYGAGGCGVDATLMCSGVNLIHNTFEDCNREATSSACINVASDFHKVEDNVIVDPNGRFTTDVHLRSDNPRIKNNKTDKTTGVIHKLLSSPKSISGAYTFAWDTNASGYKSVSLALTQFPAAKKSGDAILSGYIKIGIINAPNQFVLGASNLTISVSDSNTGWDDLWDNATTFTGLSRGGLSKAYFNGWKLTTVDTNSANCVWTGIVSGTTQTGAAGYAFVQANIDTGFTPPTLYYELTYEAQRGNGTGHRCCYGTPVGAVTPLYMGEPIFDITNSIYYKATGLVNTNWA